jgi:hypothetical protein
MLESFWGRPFIRALFATSVFVALQAKPTEIKLAVKLKIENGKITEAIKTLGDETPAVSRQAKTGEEYPSRVPKNSMIYLIIEEVHQPSATGPYDIKDHIEIEFTHADLAADKPGILTEPYFSPVFRTAGDEEPVLGMESRLPLDLPGQKYTLKISRYDSLEDKLRGKNQATVYAGNFCTHHVYYVGLNAGWLLPINKNFYSYSLYHTNPADASDGSLQTIRRTRYYQTKGLLFASFYPFGIEPEGPLSWKNIQLNLGTELSSSIMKSLYLGAGYDFRFFSINLFYGITKGSVLPEEYSSYANQTIANKKITSLPLIEKWDRFAGLAISFPFSLAAIFGKLIGL